MYEIFLLFCVWPIMCAYSPTLLAFEFDMQHCRIMKTNKFLVPGPTQWAICVLSFYEFDLQIIIFFNVCL